MATFNDARVRKINDAAINRRGGYILYWCQIYRRLRANHALDYAVQMAEQLNKPLVVYEGLKRNYPWANARIHTFMLQGMRDQVAEARRLGIHYWPFVETPTDSGHGLVAKLCQHACMLVTDDFPQFIIPAQTRAIASKVTIPVIAIDGNGMIPLARLGPAVAAAAHLRPRIHKLFAEAWHNRAAAEPQLGPAARKPIDPLFSLWEPPQDLDSFVKTLGVDLSVPAVTEEGGWIAARSRLEEFLREKLPRYAEHRNDPDHPRDSAASGLSSYLHAGHIGIQDVCEALLGSNWTPEQLIRQTRNKDDFFCRDANINSFLDEAITWRDVGYHWHYCRNRDLTANAASPPWKSWQNPEEVWPAFNFQRFDFTPLSPKGTLAEVLPAWALENLARHASDRRDYLYDLAQFEAAETHDPLWNAAQTELVLTGRIHNYLRMLWGKKVLEWSETPETGYRILEHLNNKYALDGRDPNSYTGILWCFGLFDRPWPADRPVFGHIRFMSSENTAKKFNLDPYLEYIKNLKTTGRSGCGEGMSNTRRLF
jgi:deoxyribodipyrimidine photo-lyase